MQTLSKQKLESLPREGSFRLRGLEMTRIEVFVDAAFAFAVTMLVISFDAIPSTFDEMVSALKGVPAFVVSAAQLIWIWYEHNKWSRRYGLEDVVTIVLSAALLMVMLVYIYPLRVMIEGMFTWFTGGYLPAGINLESFQQLSFMFVFLGIGFTVLSLIFVLMYRHALSQADKLQLNDIEHYETRTICMLWMGFMAIGVLAIVLALAVPVEHVPWTGFTYMLLSVWGFVIGFSRHRSRPRQVSV